MTGIPLSGSGYDPITRAMLAQATAPTQINHPLQGVARLTGALAARRGMDVQEEKRKAQEEAQAADYGLVTQALAEGGPAALASIAHQVQSPKMRQAIVQALSSQKPAKRDILKGADGYNYYTDTRERVLPGVEKPVDHNKMTISGSDGKPTLNPLWVEGKNLTRGPAPSASASVTTPAPLSPFEEGMEKRDVAAFGKIMDAGVAANRNLGRINQLDKALQAVPTGATGAFKAWAGNWGIPTEGLDDLQSAQAMINSLVPAQREPGSGPMSDADLDLFKQSLPRLINQPGGNAKIVQTLREINMYDRKLGEIANEVAAGRITRDEGRKQMSELGNPLSGFLGSEAIGASPLPPGWVIKEKP